MNRVEAEELFGLDGKYSESDVETAFRRLARQFHPDLNDTDTTFMMQRVNEAHYLLRSVLASDNGTSRVSQPQRETDTKVHRRQQDDRVRREQEAEREFKAHQAYVDASRAAEKAKTYEEHVEVAEMFRRLGDYRDARDRWSHHRTVAANIQRRNRELEAEYLRACEEALTANTAEACLIIAERFRKLGNYKDSESYADYFENLAAEKQIVEDERRYEQQKTLRLTVRATNVLYAGLTIFLCFNLMLPTIKSVDLIGNMPLPMRIVFLGPLVIFPLIISFVNAWSSLRKDGVPESDEFRKDIIYINIFGMGVFLFIACMDILQMAGLFPNSLSEPSLSFDLYVAAQMISCLGCAMPWNKGGIPSKVFFALVAIAVFIVGLTLA